MSQEFKSVFVKKPVNTRPDYYESKSGLECWTAIQGAVEGKEGYEGFLVGNIIKYLWRYEQKGGLKDVCKAEEYIKQLKAIVTKESEATNE
jgi:hypothetical protein